MEVGYHYARYKKYKTKYKTSCMKLVAGASGAPNAHSEANICFVETGQENAPLEDDGFGQLFAHQIGEITLSGSGAQATLTKEATNFVHVATNQLPYACTIRLQIKGEGHTLAVVPIGTSLDKPILIDNQYSTGISCYDGTHWGYEPFAYTESTGNILPDSIITFMISRDHNTLKILVDGQPRVDETILFNGPLRFVVSMRQVGSSVQLL